MVTTEKTEADRLAALADWRLWDGDIHDLSAGWTNHWRTIRAALTAQKPAAAVDLEALNKKIVDGVYDKYGAGFHAPAITDAVIEQLAAQGYLLPKQPAVDLSAIKLRCVTGMKAEGSLRLTDVILIHSAIDYLAAQGYLTQPRGGGGWE